MVLLGVWGVDLSLSTLHHDDSTDQLPRLQAALFWANTLRLALWDCSFSFFCVLPMKPCGPVFPPFFHEMSCSWGQGRHQSLWGTISGALQLLWLLRKHFGAHLNKGKLTNTRNCKVVLLPHHNLQKWCWKVQVVLYHRFGSNLSFGIPPYKKHFAGSKNET